MDGQRKAFATSLERRGSHSTPAKAGYRRLCTFFNRSVVPIIHARRGPQRRQVVDGDRGQVFRQAKGERADCERADFRGSSRMEGGSVHHRARMVCIYSLYDSHPCAPNMPDWGVVQILSLGKSTIYRSHPAHAPTAPRPSQTRPSSCVVPPPHRRLLNNRAPRASAIAYASSAPKRRTRSSAPPRTQPASRSSRLRRNTRGWHSTRSRSALRDCSSPSSRLLAVAGARTRCAMTGVCTVRSLSSGWKSVRGEAGAPLPLLPTR